MTKISQLPPLADTGMGPDMLFPTVANGITQKMTSEQLRNLCMPGFYFPADPSLTAADSGKIVVNSGGKAKVANADGSIPGTPGQWDIKASLQIVAPKQAAYTIGLMTNPLANDKFDFFGKTWTFVSDTPETDFEIEIGADNEATMANLVSAMNDYGNGILYAFSYTSGPSGILNIGSYYPGNSGNFPGFYTTNPALYCTSVSTGYDGDYYNLGQTVMEWKKNGTTYELSILNVCNPSAPAGSMVLGFKWPTTTLEQLQNLFYVLNNTPEFTDHFSLVDMAGMLRATETLPPVTSVTEFDESSAHFDITVHENSTLGVVEYVTDVVLGPLLYITEDLALISTDRIFRAQLSPDSAPVEFGATPAHPFNRILMYGDNGTVTGPVPFGDDMPTEFFGNGFVLALEEGTPGNPILVQAFFFPGGG